MNLQRPKVVPQRKTEWSEFRDAGYRGLQSIVKFSLNLENREAGKGLHRDARTDAFVVLRSESKVIADFLPRTRAGR